MAAISNAVDTSTNNQVSVTVAPARFLTRRIGPFSYTYVGGDSLKVSAFEVAILRREGVIV